MHPLETYFAELREARNRGVAETTHYAPLRTLLNEVAKLKPKLKPEVRCILHPGRLGQGLPDGGLFTRDQLLGNADDEPQPDTPPSRGAIEAKPVADDAFKWAQSEQVGKYLERCRQVLVTNIRDFVLVDLDCDKKRRTLEHYRLAPDEESFWQAAAHPRATAEREGERFAEFLRRVMLHQADLTAPKDLAWFLASYAREARWRVEHHKLPALESLREALEQALGLKFKGEKGEHFFRSTLVQTLFYGVFAA